MLAGNSQAQDCGNSVMLMECAQAPGSNFATFFLRDAEDPLAESNGSGVDVDDNGVAGTDAGTIVTYHLSQLDAENDENPIGPALNPTINAANKTIYVRIESEMNECISVLPLWLAPCWFNCVPIRFIFLLCGVIAMSQV